MSNGKRKKEEDRENKRKKNYPLKKREGGSLC
jgi:hypothetical protein